METKEKSILNQEAAIIKAANFDQAKLNKVDAVEKSVLPTDEGLLRLMIYLTSFSDIKREKTIVNITSFDKESLKKTETVEKMALPTADDIQAEK